MTERPATPSQPLSVVLLAAGMGSRYGGLKQVDPVGPSGELVIDYSIHDALAVGFTKLVFVIRKDIETDFREAIGSRYENRCEVHYVFQELDRVPPGCKVPRDRKKPWGTGQAMLVAADAVQEPCAVINADDFYGKQGFQLLANHLRSVPPASTQFALAGFILRNTLSDHGTVSRGVCSLAADGRLETVTEHTKIARDGTGAVSIRDDGTRQPLTGDELVSMNMWGFTPALFPCLRRGFERFLKAHGDDVKAEFFLPTAIDAMVKSGTASVRVLPSADQWFGITYREDKPTVVKSIRRLVEQGAYRSPLQP